MTTRMLIDARHREETRVAVLKGNRIEEFDFESAEHKQIKGNIYLAKVTRVEPSLQAAFVDYGGNRHGFLAFSEIHPDYYQIPLEDRQALLAEEAEHAEEEAALRAEEEAEEDAHGHDRGDDDADDDQDDDDDSDHDEESSDAFADELADDSGVSDAEDEPITAKTVGEDDDDSDESDDSGKNNRRGNQRGQRRRGKGRGQAKRSDDVKRKRIALRRRYKIQDVVHRRQLVLVQVVKEERGNKGAALTTYLSLAGRYCVLMPNSAHGGGISRKISNAGDRKRLKSIIADMALPPSMGCIVRTAGLSRTKTEIKRDFDYLARLWDEIRDRALKASAPANIHSDSDLIKRAIRDIYNREISEVLVEGDEGYRAAKDFMKLLMPSHARRVKHYADAVPMFQRYGAEDQLSAMYEPMVQLKSGGYLVINPTEALVSIDINSGRSTKEHGIEQTALNTNLEAAKEIARQLRLRDMAGLVVIDFIDMEYGNNIRKVEKAMRDALKNDRARIQVGRISSFGLMEMSRQRLRTGVLEASTRTCPHCEGTGLVRTASSAGLSALRMLEEEAAKGKGTVVTLRASNEASVYVLNHKRHDIVAIEERYGVHVEVLPDGEVEGARMIVEVSGPRPENAITFTPIVDDDDDDTDEDNIEEDDRDDSDDRNEDSDDDRPKRRSRGRSRRRRGRGRDGDSGDQDNSESSNDNSSSETADQPERAERGGQDDDSDGKPKRNRRGRRGGRGRNRGGRDRNENGDTDSQDTGSQNTGANSNEGGEGNADTAPSESPAEQQPAAEAAEKPKRTRRKKAEPVAESAAAAPEVAAAADEGAAEEKPKPKRTRRKKADSDSDTAAKADDSGDAKAEEKPKRVRKPRKTAAEKAAEAEAATAEPAKAEKKKKAAEPQAQSEQPASQSADSAPDSANSSGPARKGWWQRTFG